ncbi:uncharacterized protein LOC131153824 [Malania oleifera]|uniref:uncharacterized protein LOC131153824 n=1 Tax=Malania oleifera TaxID=397392 RepID=UPI0025AE6009|nr:uncharacterized protein LOC131153824 [Malania oleifera]
MLLTEYNITCATRKAIKGSIIVDYLADKAVEDYQPMEFDFPNKDIDSIRQEEEDHEGWRMLFDGTVNVWGHGIGVILISSEGRHYPVVVKLTFLCSNNMAEYEACILGLQAAIDHGIRELAIKRDSTLVIHQLTGEWETRDSKLVSYEEYIQEMIKEFDSISFSHLPKENNLNPNALATLVVRHHNSAPYRSQMNGVMKAANKNIKNILEKMTETYKDWHDKLPFTLLAYRTTVHTSPGATLFSLVYGMEAIVPIEVEIPSLQILKEAKLTEVEWIQSQYD